ncbi:hypothetical protein PTSG_12616 [Salpingoeca rosetta]|uniref:Uncharacterized protein n=1 Tax=Salpingoeca rosetta (strain ATCC 50818 / BSB-021) TaxID=946362 RepID=F2UHD8_SALR5|nr:uncharacterized protein PTSG_12616 [Salpingoeca rosetta]EGD76537.1 hypothetical protein PTSG_12616 [Salpingoeca rosetta]|eukprot:XP_004991451.1 hypothetical protein PTSG_12616 [Salpingoeca rosetta]
MLSMGSQDLLFVPFLPCRPHPCTLLASLFFFIFFIFLYFELLAATRSFPLPACGWQRDKATYYSERCMQCLVVVSCRLLALLLCLATPDTRTRNNFFGFVFCSTRRRDGMQ